MGQCICSPIASTGIEYFNEKNNPTSREFPGSTFTTSISFKKTNLVTSLENQWKSWKSSSIDDLPHIVNLEQEPGESEEPGEQYEECEQYEHRQESHEGYRIKSQYLAPNNSPNTRVMQRTPPSYSRFQRSISKKLQHSPEIILAYKEHSRSMDRRKLGEYPLSEFPVLEVDATQVDASDLYGTTILSQPERPNLLPSVNSGFLLSPDQLIIPGNNSIDCFKVNYPANGLKTLTPRAHSVPVTGPTGKTPLDTSDTSPPVTDTMNVMDNVKESATSIDKKPSIIIQRRFVSVSPFVPRSCPPILVGKRECSKRPMRQRYLQDYELNLVRQLRQDDSLLQQLQNRTAFSILIEQEEFNDKKKIKVLQALDFLPKLSTRYKEKKLDKLVFES